MRFVFIFVTMNTMSHGLVWEFPKTTKEHLIFQKKLKICQFGEAASFLSLWADGTQCLIMLAVFSIKL